VEQAPGGAAAAGASLSFLVLPSVRLELTCRPPQPETPTKGKSASQNFLEKLQTSVKVHLPSLGACLSWC